MFFFFLVCFLFFLFFFFFFFFFFVFFCFFFFFFFQAEDGIRDTSVTGVQTCALPICHLFRREPGVLPHRRDHRDPDVGEDVGGRAPDREHAEERDHDGQHDEGVRTPKRQLDDPHEPRTLTHGGKRRKLTERGRALAFLNAVLHLP